MVLRRGGADDDDDVAAEHARASGGIFAVCGGSDEGSSEVGHMRKQVRAGGRVLRGMRGRVCCIGMGIGREERWGGRGGQRGGRWRWGSWPWLAVDAQAPGQARGGDEKKRRRTRLGAQAGHGT